MTLKQGMKFKAKIKTLPEYKYLYLGKIKDDCGNTRLLYNMTLKNYTVVEEQWICERKIEMIKQNEKQYEASKRVAKKRKRRWIENHANDKW